MQQFEIVPQRGCVVSSDGFYTEMMGLDEQDSFHVASKIREFEELGCIGLDMETSVLFAIGERLSVDVASLCIATVSANTKHKLEEQVRKEAERRMCLVGLKSLLRGNE